MSNTVKLNNCPKCNAPISPTAPQGLCPKCLLLGAVAATDMCVPATATSEIPSLERLAAAFPQLEILELIGRGGMGFVFKARQPHLDRFVALKLLPDQLARDPRFAERFNREGRVLARLNHPNIVSIYDFGKTEHFYFLLMEFVDGVNMRQAMQAGRFSPGEALGIVPKICEALQYAHEQGIMHRDIKPENILLDTRGQVKIADFGIAKLVGEEKADVSLTATGAALGTAHYMAPEQFEKPSEVDHRADIYSLGVVFYEMLTGELPIGRFAAPSSKTPVGVNVDEVVFRTLEKDRERRYQSAGEMKTQVEHLTDAGAGPRPKLAGAEHGLDVPKWSQKSVWGWGGNKPAAQRRGVLKWVFIGLVFAGIGVVLVLNFLGREARRAPAEAASGASQGVSPDPAKTAPWIRFTFTAVELREVQGVRWLAIDYVDDVHGDCQKSFPWETTIPGFKAETRTTEFLSDSNKDSPPVRHQRVEYRMPDSSPRDQLERLRDNLEKALKQKSFRLELGENQVPLLLFELPGTEGGSLQARIKVVAPLGQASSPPARAAAKSSALEFRLIADAADAQSPVDELPERHKDGSETKLRVLRTVMLDGSSVARAGIEFDPNGSRAIAVELTSEGARQFGAITAANIDRQLAIVANGKVLSAPVIKTAITGGELKISGSFSPSEVGKLVAELNRKPAGLEFSDVIERSLPRAPEGQAICLDLESGFFKTNHTFRPGQRDTLDWLSTNGADLRAVGAADQIPVMDTFGLASIEAPTNAWDSMLPQDIGWNWALMRDAAKQESQLATTNGRPDTFLFRTRENGFGLLQILTVTNPASEVKIRYKLIEAEGTKQP